MTERAGAVADPRALLAKYGFAPKKSWGQNFLVAESVYAAIVRAAARAEDDWVVEIGAGLGTLTARLADAVPAGRVVAVERDRDMVTVLRGELAARANVEIAEANALAFDYGAVAAAAGKPVAVAGNLPYQIASPLIFNLLDARRHLSRAVIMLQKEMADRIRAKPGTSEYGALGVMVTTVADVRLVVKAPAGAFHPRPKVDSAVIELVPLVAPRFALGDEKQYSRVVHAAFGQRRKTLRNALRSAFDDAAVDGALAATGINGQRRGETLDLAEFAALARELSGAHGTSPPTPAGGGGMVAGDA
jgi:16S rRNA (adenine1518-N6/adenine1519-N6)-dimethyltransferase